MTGAPSLIDGARVLCSADLSGVAATGRTQHLVRGELVEAFAALAIARYDADPGVYLFYCDADWRPVTDTQHETVKLAVQQAEFEFGPLEFLDAAGPEAE